MCTAHFGNHDIIIEPSVVLTAFICINAILICNMSRVILVKVVQDTLIVPLLTSLVGSGEMLPPLNLGSPDLQTSGNNLVSAETSTILKGAQVCTSIRDLGTFRSR